MEGNHSKRDVPHSALACHRGLRSQQVTGLGSLHFDLVLIVFTFLDCGFSQWASLRAVCLKWHINSMSSKWLSLLRPTCRHINDLQAVSRLAGLQTLRFEPANKHLKNDGYPAMTSFNRELKKGYTVMLANVTSLQELDIGGQCRRLSDNHLRAFSAFPLLHTLKLNSLYQSTQIFNILIKALPLLRVLHLDDRSQMNIPDFGGQTFLLEELSLEASIGLQGELIKLRAFPLLKRLNVSRNSNINDTDVKSLLLEDGSCRLMLESLNLRACHGVSDFSLQCVALLTSLRSLNMAGCLFTEQAACMLMSLTGLEGLVLPTWRKHSLQRTISVLTCLTSLDCNGTMLCKELQFLSFLANLDVLFVDDIIDAEQLQHVALSTNLRELHLSACRISGGVKWLSSLSKLFFLDISRCQISGSYDL